VRPGVPTTILPLALTPATKATDHRVHAAMHIKPSHQSMTDDAPPE
jgi:hypothetical protein